MQEYCHTGCYLGNSCNFKSKRGTFQVLIDKLTAKLAGWWQKHLSTTDRRTVLIKSITITIPSYAMQTTLLPISTCNQIDGMMRTFWWRATHFDRKLCLKAWEVLCNHKSSGLGFCKIKDINIAFITKFSWKL